MNRAVLQALASGAMKPKGPMASAGRAFKAAKEGPGVRGYMDAVTPGAKDIQSLLEAAIREKGHLSGLPNVHMNSLRGNVADFAASDSMLNLLRAMPAAGAVYGTTVIADGIDQAFSPEEESFANTGMDLLGMGGGAAAAYGLNRGTNRVGGTTRAGQALAAASMAGLGKLGSDALQGIIGM